MGETNQFLVTVANQFLSTKCVLWWLSFEQWSYTGVCTHKYITHHSQDVPPSPTFRKSRYNTMSKWLLRIHTN